MIVGAGPAGLAASIYLQRAGLSPLLLEKDEPGGLLRGANLIENYPGFPHGIPGEDLARLFVEQLSAVGGKVTKANVLSASSLGGAFKIETESEDIASRALILASGTKPNRSEIEGADTLEGRLVFNSVAELLRIKPTPDRIAILGGGDAAFDYGLNLKRRGKDVTIVCRSEPRCLPLLARRADEQGIEILKGAQPIQLAAADGRLQVRLREAGGDRELIVDAAITAFGRYPVLDFVAPDLRARLSRDMAPPGTGIPGLYLCGDAARGAHRQAGIAVGDGILAAMRAVDWLSTKGSQ